MHECGHGSLFRSGRLNRGFGFVLGVVTGMPQYVWLQHHQYHHATNGNWARYGGPMNIIGSSFLQLPGWLNWFTANIAYHHVHHLSARIPSYCLSGCHDEFATLFAKVRRVRLAQIPQSLRCILWDTLAQRIVSVDDYQQRAALRAA